MKNYKSDRRGGINYEALIRNRLLILVVTAFLLIFLFVLNISTGPSMLSLKAVAGTLLMPGKSAYENYVIVWIMRMPVAMMSIVIGASLGVAGAEMQTILDNPMSEPYTLGISSSASFGAAIALVFGKSLVPVAKDLAVSVNAFLFSLGSALFIFMMAKWKAGQISVVILAGVAVNFLFGSLTSILQYMATEDALLNMTHWLAGDLTVSTYQTVLIVFGIFLAGFPLLILDSWKLTALRLGDDKAKSLGVNVEFLRLKVLIIVSLITAAAVCFVGTIGFIGLAAPHISRSFIGEDHRFHIPFSAVVGAGIMSVASVISKTLVPGSVIPVGIITSIIGIPFLLSIILRGKRA